MSFPLVYSVVDATSPTLAPVLNDAGNHTLALYIDGDAQAPTNSPTDIGPGTCQLIITDAEQASGKRFRVDGTTTTPGARIVPMVDRGDLDNIAAQIAQIGSNQIVINNALASGGRVRIVQGDDYAAADGRSIPFVINNYAGPPLAGATLAFKVIDRASYEIYGASPQINIAATFTVTTVNGVTTVNIAASPTAAETELLKIFGDIKYVYQLVFTLADGHTYTPIIGGLTATPRVGG